MRKALHLATMLGLMMFGTSSIEAWPTITNDMTLRAFVHNAGLKLVDIGDTGLTPGDMLVGHGAIFDESDVHRVGRSLVHCVFPAVKRPPQCTGDFVFDAGDITVQGTLTQPQFVWA